MEDNGKSLQRSAKRWLYCFGAIMLLSFSLLGYRLVDLQVIRHAQLSDAARGNTVRTYLLLPSLHRASVSEQAFFGEGRGGHFYHAKSGPKRSEG